MMWPGGSQAQTASGRVVAGTGQNEEQVEGRAGAERVHDCVCSHVCRCVCMCVRVCGELPPSFLRKGYFLF